MMPIGTAVWLPAMPVTGIMTPPRIILKKPINADALPAFFPHRDRASDTEEAPMIDSGTMVINNTGRV